MTELAASTTKTNTPPAPKPTAANLKKQAAKKEYVASLHPGAGTALPVAFADACRRLEEGLGLPVWLLVHNDYDSNAPLTSLTLEVRNAFFRARKELAKCERVALVVDSPGGYARNAYEIARLFQRHCGAFMPVIPRYAKSAATLLVLGGEILMAADAEIGPLDAQIWDPEREELSSALNEVQALERLHSQAAEEVDQMVPLLVGRTQKKVETILPLVLDFVAKMKQPLLEKIDTVHYTQQSRVLKEAEDYAIRLLAISGLYEEPRNVAARLVNRYPDHGFVIDRAEASQFLHLTEPKSGEVTDALSDLADYLTDHELVALGRFDAKSTS